MTQEFEFTDEIVELRSMVRDFCAEFSPESVVRTTMESELGHDPALWRRLGTELGVLGLAVPEAYGGDDVGLVAQAVVVDELGAALVCGPVLGTLALAMPALCAISDDEAKGELLPALCSGDRVATLAAPLSEGSLDLAGVTVTAASDGSELGAVGHGRPGPRRWYGGHSCSSSRPPRAPPHCSRWTPPRPGWPGRRSRPSTSPAARPRSPSTRRRPACSPPATRRWPRASVLPRWPPCCSRSSRSAAASGCST